MAPKTIVLALCCQIVVLDLKAFNARDLRQISSSSYLFCILNLCKPRKKMAASFKFEIAKFPIKQTTC